MSEVAVEKTMVGCSEN
jgi:hypothetical protein